MSKQKSENYHQCRMLKLLAKHKSNGLQYSTDETHVTLRSNKREYRFPRTLVEGLSHRNYISLANETVFIKQSGIERLKYLLASDDVSGQAYIAPISGTNEAGQCFTALENLNESPLKRLYCRKNKQGERYISIAELEAGERLRRDFECGHLQPKITANLESGIGQAGKGAKNPHADISDFALDARQRVYKAMDLLGPDLSGAILDICCFLKGLELVERERSWPPRSAKLMLKTGLSLLAKHYGLIGTMVRRESGISSWGTSDYRPNI